MSDSPKRCGLCAKTIIYGVTFLAVILIGYLLAHAMRSYLPKTELNANRAKERSAARVELNNAAKNELFGPAVTLKPGVVRLPINRAMELTIQGYKDGAAFRTNLNARVEKAFAPPPKVSYE
jgi:hypothetical protein